MPPKAKKRTMTPQHKKALAEGRSQSKAVRDYLEALREHKPRRGRKRTPQSIKKRLAALEDALAESNAIQELELLQERKDLEAELDRLESKSDASAYESGFVKHARGYSERKGISYATFREVGVPAEVLRKAGIGRGA